MLSRFIEEYCCYSVTHLCPTLCDPMNWSMPGLFVPHHLPEFVQVHVHCIGDAIQSSHPLTSSFFCTQSLPSGTFSMRLFTSGYQNTGASVSFNHKNTKVLSQSIVWMDLENIILNKKSLMWKDKYCMTPIMWNT